MSQNQGTIRFYGLICARPSCPWLHSWAAAWVTFIQRRHPKRSEWPKDSTGPEAQVRWLRRWTFVADIQLCWAMPWRSVLRRTGLTHRPQRRQPKTTKDKHLNRLNSCREHVVKMAFVRMALMKCYCFGSWESCSSNGFDKCFWALQDVQRLRLLKIISQGHWIQLNRFSTLGVTPEPRCTCSESVDAEFLMILTGFQPVVHILDTWWQF